MARPENAPRSDLHHECFGGEGQLGHRPKGAAGILKADGLVNQILPAWQVGTFQIEAFEVIEFAKLQEYGFDTFVEKRCRRFYAEGVGRPGIAPGVYFRMLMIGYFEGLDSERGIAWRCADSASLKVFLGYRITEAIPDHSSLSVIRQRLLVHVGAFNLSLVMRKVIGRGTPRGLHGAVLSLEGMMEPLWRAIGRRLRRISAWFGTPRADNESVSPQWLAA